MARSAGLVDALALLVDERSSSRGQLRMLASTQALALLEIGLAVTESFDEKQLAKHIFDEGDPWTVIAASRLSSGLARAVRRAPPGLLILAGDASPAERERLDALQSEGISVLGPNASIKIGEGEGLRCAGNTDELAGLLRSAAPYKLALAPTPSWLLTWLASPSLSNAPPIGYITRDGLNADWSSWVREQKDHHALIPLGVEQVDLSPFEPGLERVAAAHALERLTGPVFPAPRVLGLLLNPPPSTGAPSADDLAMWHQARRALPLTGGVPGMSQPEHDVELAVPTAAFLAQRARLRRRVALENLVEPDGAADPLVDSSCNLDRCLEVLTACGEALSEHEAKVVLRRAGIQCTRQAVAASASGAVQFADKIGYPVVLKPVSPDLRRKKDAGLVLLDLANAAAVRRGHANILETLRALPTQPRIDGVMVAEQVPAGLDLRCGMTRSAGGAPIFFGQGQTQGLYTEPVLAAGPLSERDALLLANSVISSLRIPPLRRDSDPSVRALAKFFAGLNAMVIHTERRLIHVEVAPLRLLDEERGFIALDARIEQEPHEDGL